MTPVAVMKCPKCRFGMVYKYGTILECERCGYTDETAVENHRNAQEDIKKSA